MPSSAAPGACRGTDALKKWNCPLAGGDWDGRLDSNPPSLKLRRAGQATPLRPSQNLRVFQGSPTLTIRCHKHEYFLVISTLLAVRRRPTHATLSPSLCDLQWAPCPATHRKSQMPVHHLTDRTIAALPVPSHRVRQRRASFIQRFTELWFRRSSGRLLRVRRHGARRPRRDARPTRNTSRTPGTEGVAEVVRTGQVRHLARCGSPGARAISEGARVRRARRETTQQRVRAGPAHRRLDEDARQPRSGVRDRRLYAEPKHSMRLSSGTTRTTS